MCSSATATMEKHDERRIYGAQTMENRVSRTNRRVTLCSSRSGRMNSAATLARWMSSSSCPGTGARGRESRYSKPFRKATCGPLRSPPSCSASHRTMSAPEGSMNVSVLWQPASRWFVHFHKIPAAQNWHPRHPAVFSLGEDFGIPD